METDTAESTIMPNIHLTIPSSPLTFCKSLDVARCFIRFSILDSLLPLDSLFPRRAHGADDHVPERLVRHVPVLGGGTAADIGGSEQRGHHDPGVADYVRGAEKFKFHGNVIPPGDPSQPSLFLPAGENFRRPRPRHTQHVRAREIEMAKPD